VISATKWFRTFKRQLPKDPGIKLLEHMYDKRGSWGNDTQWTHVVSVSLMRLAREMACFQLCRKIDFVWYRGKSKDPFVFIEHENDYRKVCKSELRNLLSTTPNKYVLRVLITYTWVDRSVTARRIAQVERSILRSIKRGATGKTWTGELLIIIGHASAEEEGKGWRGYWRGWVLDRSRHFEALV